MNFEPYQSEQCAFYLRIGIFLKFPKEKSCIFMLEYILSAKIKGG